MTTKIRTRSSVTNSSGSWLRQQVLKRFSQLETGQITLVDGDQEWQFGDSQAPSELSATVTVTNQQLYRYVALGGSIGAAESYMAGDWQADDLTTVVRIFVLNQTLLNNMERGMARLSAPLFRWLHKRNRNTRDGLSLIHI